MGLCKCPKRRVTNLFCFVHRVNVCEDCMTTQHPRCVVRSYLQWLQDSDYDPVCPLCSQSLEEGEVVRLGCHDIFHLPCLDNFVSSRPAGSSVGGLTCPHCHESLFPSPRQVSPVLDKLRLVLRAYQWGREGLGIDTPSVGDYEEEEDEILTTSLAGGYNHLTSTPRTVQTKSAVDGFPVESHASQVTLQLYEDHPVNRGTSASSSNIQLREQQQQWSSPLMVNTAPPPQKHDSDDSKYKRKSPLEGFTRWFRQQHRWRLPADDMGTRFRRYLLLIILACAVGVTLIVFMTRVGRGVASRDPNLDWRLNQQIRIGGD